MARITVEDCLANVKNRFELVLVAAHRARDLMRAGTEPHVAWENDKATVVALREIAEGFVNASILDSQPAAPRASSRSNEFNKSIHDMSDISDTQIELLKNALESSSIFSSHKKTNSDGGESSS